MEFLSGVSYCSKHFLKSKDADENTAFTHRKGPQDNPKRRPHAGDQGGMWGFAGGVHSEEHRAEQRMQMLSSLTCAVLPFMQALLFQVPT